MADANAADLELLALAREAATRAHAPYSRFRVGAVAVVDGRRFLGCNVENASYGLTACAERVAMWSAVADGQRQISRLAVACIDAPPDAPSTSRMPCGACRQVMAELFAADAVILVEGVGQFTIADLLPGAFGR